MGGVSPLRPDRDLHLRRSGFSVFPDIFEHFDCSGGYDAGGNRFVAHDADHCDRGDRYLGRVYDWALCSVHGSMS
jgi:hypothetical protein